MRIIALCVAVALGFGGTAAYTATVKHKATKPRRTRSVQKRPPLPGPLPYVGPRGDVVSRGWAPRLLRRPNPNLDVRALLLQTPSSDAAQQQPDTPPNAERLIEISKSRHTLALVQNGKTVGVFLLNGPAKTANPGLSNLAGLPVGTFYVADLNQDGAGHKALVLASADQQPDDTAAADDVAQVKQTGQALGSYVGLPAPGLDLVCSFARVGMPVVIKP